MIKNFIKSYPKIKIGFNTLDFKGNHFYLLNTDNSKNLITQSDAEWFVIRFLDALISEQTKYQGLWHEEINEQYSGTLFLRDISIDIKRQVSKVNFYITMFNLYKESVNET